jgi:hypothetical protein
MRGSLSISGRDTATWRWCQHALARLGLARRYGTSNWTRGHGLWRFLAGGISEVPEARRTIRLA